MAEDISTLVVKVKTDGVTAAATRLDKLAVAADKAEKAVQKLGTQVVTSNAQMAGSAGATVALTNAILLLNQNITNLSGSQQRNTQQTRQNTLAMRDAHDAARGLAGSLGMLWTTYGNAVALGTGLAIGASMKGIISTGAQVEHAIESMRVKGGETVETANQLRESILSIGQGVYGPKEVAGAFDALILAGLSAKESMSAVKASLNLATAGGSTVEKAAESLVTIGTAVGASASQYDMLADGITKAANTSLASVDSIAQAMKRASVVNKLYGATFEDILIQASALSQLGIKNTAAGTAITNFYGDAIGKTDKAKAAMKELGMSFFDAAGKARPLVETFEDLNSKLRNFSEKKQVQLMEDMFGERAKRDVVGILDLVRTGAKDADTYKNRLQEIAGEINNMAGTAALASAQLSLTSENQMKSVKNTLETTFVRVFQQIEPQLNIVTMRMKQAFASPEFTTALSNIATGIGNVTVALAENAGTVMAVVEGILAYKMITTGGAIFSAMIPLVNGLAVSFGAVGVAANGAAVATGIFGRAIMLLPGIGLVLGGIAAVMALIAINSKKMKDNAELTAEAYNTNYLDALKTEAERLEKTNELMWKGATAAEANATATRELALAKAQANNQTAIEAALKKRNDAQAVLDATPGSARNDMQEARHATAVAALAEAQTNLDNTLHNASLFESEVKKTADRVIAASEAQRQLYHDEQKRNAADAAAASGTNEGAAKPDKQLTKMQKFAQEELQALEQQLEGYRARTEALVQYGETGVRVEAKIAQARVEQNIRNGEYANKAAAQAALEMAAKVDRARFEKQNADQITEQQNKITEVLNRKAAYESVSNVKGYESMGIIEQKTFAMLKEANATDALIEKEMKRARVADEFLRVQAAQEKLRSATGNANQRAGMNENDADAMLKFGKAAKGTAVEVAQLEVEKLKLANTGSDLLIKQRMEAAGMEDISIAYKNMAKLMADLNKQEGEEAAIGAAGVIGAETAKVVAHQAATQAIIDSNLERAKSGLEAAEAGGDDEKIAAARATYAKMEKLSADYGKRIQKHMTIDLKVAKLKDVSNMFSSLGNAASKMGDQFAHVGTALNGVAESFATLSDIRKKEGIGEMQRTQEQIGAYGDMASASANFFQEGSRGYKTMMGISKVFHAAEMAMGVVRLGQMAIGAVLNQANGDPYTAFGRMAAMAAIVAALGFAVGGGFSSSKGGEKAEDVQKKQGTGSVFGDSDAKSDSIKRSLDMLKDNSNIMLPVNQAMLRSLQGIEASMGGLTNLVLRTDGVANGTNMGIQTGKLGGNGMNFLENTLMGTNAAGGAVAGFLLGGPIGAAIGSFVGEKLGKLWGSTKQTIVDSGLSFGGKVTDLQNGDGFNQYASVDTTKKSAFGLKKKTTNAVKTQGLNDELSSQFGLIFTNLEDTLKVAAGSLGSNSKAVEDAINNMVLSSTKVSLKDLKGEELQAAINGVISKSMDEIAQKVYPNLDAFRQVGEGYAETVLRVASGVEQAKFAMESFGITAVDYKSVINKQGDVAVEIARQSIGVAEGFTGINDIMKNMTGTIEEVTEMYGALVAIRKQMNGLGLNGNSLDVNTIKGAGGVSQLKSALDGYQDKYFTDQEKSAIMLKSLTAEFGKLNVALPASKNAFRALIEATGTTTPETSKLTGQLLALSEAYSELIDMNSEAQKEAADKLETSIDGLKQFSEALKEFKDSLLLGDLSTLTPTEKYLEAKSQYEATVAKAMEGDATAQGNLTGMAQAYLEASRTVFASSPEYASVFDKVVADMSKLEEYTGTQLTAAEKELQALQTQVDSLNALNVTAQGIRDGIDNLSIAPNPVGAGADTEALEAEVERLRAEAAEQAAANAKQMNDLMSVVYDSGDRTANALAAALEKMAERGGWWKLAADTINQER